MAAIRMMVMGAGAAGAAAVAVFTQPFSPGDDDQIEAVNAFAAGEICLKSDLIFFKGVKASCYSRDGLSSLADAPVADINGDPVSMTMTHPTDFSIDPVVSRTCREYREMQFDGWYAPTSRDMRREAYFIRACGVLAALDDASPPKRSFFAEGGLTAEDVASLAAAFRFGESEMADALTVEKGEAHKWFISADSLSLTLQELANADFDNDGVEEILAFTTGAPEGGTAVFYDVGLIERDTEEAALTFTPLPFGRGEPSGAAG